MSRRDREEFLDRDVDDEEDIQYGIRRSRRNVSIQYRDSSSLNPLQVMQQEVYYENALLSLQRAIDVATVVSALVLVYNHYRRRRNCSSLC